MSDRYETEEWSVRLPTGWSGEVDDDTVLLSAEGGPGLMQLRSFRSEGRDIVDDDLRELAKPHTDHGAPLYPVKYGGFSGFYVHFESEGTLWYEWWLRRGRLAMHVTYHLPQEKRSEEEATVAAILSTLQDRRIP
jgi:hypothetical protein